MNYYELRITDKMKTYNSQFVIRISYLCIKQQKGDVYENYNVDLMAHTAIFRKLPDF